MRRAVTLTVFATLTIPVLTSAKEKQPKSPMPFTVLKAQTIAVVINPDAGRSVRNPQGNETAQRDVETALGNWGRFQTTISYLNADLIIVIRKGTGHIADATISDPRSNGVPVGQAGNQPGLDNRPPPTNPGTPTAQGDISSTEDSFLVYDGKTQAPLNSPPIWRYNGMDGLRSHSVSAVDAFRKAVTETEKIAAAKNQ